MPVNSVVVNPLAVEVELREAGDTGMSTVDTPLPPVFYVIVGAGPAAVINHSTLIRSAFGKARLEDSPAGKLPILHIGFPNPWSRYMKHGMGQPPYLLSLPAFASANQPHTSTEVECGGLNSRVFAGAVDGQFSLLLKKQKAKFASAPQLKQTPWWPWMEGWVAALQTRKKEPIPPEDLEALQREYKHKEVLDEILALIAAPYPNFLNPKIAPYRILTVRQVDDGWKAEFVYAQFIDVCTGTGRPRANLKPDNEKARTPPWLPPGSWKTVLGERRILSAADAICDDTVWTSTDRICVPKGGGIGLNAAEKAVTSDSFLDFFDSKSMVAQTFTNPRNYTFLSHWSEKGPRKSGEGKTTLPDEELIPHHAKTRMGQNAELGKVAMSKVEIVKGTAVDKVEVELRPLPGAIIRAADGVTTAGLQDGCWQSTGQPGEPAPSQNYDYLALPQGLAADGIGQPAWFLKPAGAPVVITTDSNNRMAALKTADDVIRILGAAAQVYLGFDFGTYKPQEPANTPKDKMWLFRTVLPISAVPDGFILASINIAKANLYFDEQRKNLNLNTMTSAEIETVLAQTSAAQAASQLAPLLLRARNPSNGYADSGDLLAKLRKYIEGISITADENMHLVETHSAVLRTAFRFANLPGDQGKNLNLNTMKVDEIKAVLEQTSAAQAASQLAPLLLARKPSNGYADPDDLLAKHREYTKETLETAKENMRLVETHSAVLRTAFRFAYLPEDD